MLHGLDLKNWMLERSAILLHKSYAELLFGRNKGLGDSVILTGGDRFEVVGILEDTPSVLRNVRTFQDKRVALHMVVYTYFPTTYQYFSDAVCLLPGRVPQAYVDDIQTLFQDMRGEVGYFQGYTLDYHRNRLDSSMNEVMRLVNFVIVGFLTVSSIYLLTIYLFFSQET